MAMKKRPRNQMWRRLRARRDNPETTRQYTPQDYRNLAAQPQHKNGEGVLRPDTGDLHLPAGLEDVGEDQRGRDSSKVIIIITILALIFISIITYFVSQMPKKD
jgi:hypothetical protein